MSSSNAEVWVVSGHKQSWDFLRLHVKMKIFSNFQDIRQYLDCSDITKPDVVIFELTVNDMNFFDFIAEDHNSELLRLINFIVVSPIDEVDIARRCYDAGALLFALEPIAPGEFKAFLEAKVLGLEREDKMIKNMFNGVVDTTQVEEQILYVFSRMKNYRANGDSIKRYIWAGQNRHDKTFEVHISNLKKKLEKVGYTITRLDEDYTLHKIGFGE